MIPRVGARIRECDPGRYLQIATMMVGSMSLRRINQLRGFVHAPFHASERSRSIEKGFGPSCK